MPHVLAGKPKLRALLNRQAKLAYPAQGDLPGTLVRRRLRIA